MQFVAKCEGCQEQVWRKAWVDDGWLGLTNQTCSPLSGVKESLTKTQIWPGFNGPGDVHLAVGLFTGLPTVNHQLDTHTNCSGSGPSQTTIWLQALMLDWGSSWSWIKLVKLSGFTWNCTKALRRLFKPTTDRNQIHFSTGICINRPMNMYTKAKLASVQTFDLVVEICTYSNLINQRNGA